MHSTNRTFYRAALAASALVACGCHKQTAGTVSSTAPTATGTRGKHAVGGQAAERTPLPPTGVRGIYLTGWTAGSKNALAHLIALTHRTNINAMVIDVKDDGELSYDVPVPLAREAKASRKMIGSIDKLLDRLNREHIWTIARIACFRDTPLAKAHPELAVHNASGGLFRNGRYYWLNPYQKKNWDYNVDIALDALKHGFKEVQFDYVRFPSEGRVNTLSYPGRPAGALREDQISKFMKYAREKIHAHGGWFSCDVFGLTSLVTNDEGIGQKFFKVVQNVDFLSPMVYPSHYHRGEYGIANPNTEPYKLITHTVGDAQKRIKSVSSECRLRPWIQDFSLGGVHYGPAQVRAQIKALNALGIHDYLLWNANCRFTEAALKDDTLGSDKRPAGNKTASQGKPGAPAGKTK